ncbi:MAG: hypothetical protein FWC53_02065, partial [Firmicutes bacterium]|nr:hypothetical protein [Bacillota bacterium]
MKNIHNEKGITLATLAIYIISMLIALAILATVTAYFHGAFKDTTKNTADIAEWDKFNLYFLDEVKASGSGISAPIKEGSTNAAFINGNTYEYNASDKAVYLVNSKENIKVAQNVEKCTFHSSQTDGKTIVTVAMTIGGNERSEDYVLGEGAVSNYEEENNYIAVDTTAPTITISAPSSTIVRNGASVTYTVTYADNNFDKSTLKAADITLNKTGTADAAVAVTGAGTTYTVTISNVTGAGTLGISIAAGTASDKAGNMAPVAGPSQTFAIDNTAPPAPILAQAPTAWTNGSVTVTATHPADSTVKEYSTDGTAWNAYTTPVVVDANGTVYARYKDSLGNLSATGSIVITNIDKIAPTVAFGTNGGVTKTGSTTVTVSDTGGSGVNPGSLQYVWSTSTTDPGTGYLLFTNGAVLTGPTMQNGAYYLWIKASDNAGNTVAGGAVRSNAFTTDNIAPTITISAPSSALVKGGASVTYTVTYADTNFNSSTLAVANITLNKTGTANGTVAVSGTGLTRTVTISNVTGDGTLGISIAAGTATDTAGNTAPAAGPSATFTVDSTAPTCTITANPSANPTNASSITYTFTFSEAVTGFA